MVRPVKSEEFLGRFQISFQDGKIIYAYDEITHGLYKFSFELKEVSLALSPEILHRHTQNIIRGVSKYGDEIILIPSYLDSEWIFFDVKKETVRYESPIRGRTRISGVITTDTNLVLIPADTGNPIIVVSTEQMRVIKTFEKWYGQDGKNIDTGTAFEIWGASSCGGRVVFPVVNSNQIGCISGEDVRIITLDIPNPVCSVSVCRDKIWILPVSGEYIYAADFKGDIVDSFPLSRIESGISADAFIRIVSVEENIILFPVYGGKICVYQYGKNQVMRLGGEEKHLRGRLFEENLIPHWDYVIENEMLHILPCDCRYKKICIDSLEYEECSFRYGENMDPDKYWKLMGDIKRACILEKGESDLEDFLQYTTHRSYGNDSAKEDKKTGTKIWKIMR